jgi:hypothetical protein
MSDLVTPLDLDALSALVEAVLEAKARSEKYGYGQLHETAMNDLGNAERAFNRALTFDVARALVTRVRAAEAKLTVERIAAELHSLERFSTIDPAQCIRGPEFDRNYAVRLLAALDAKPAEPVEIWQLPLDRVEVRSAVDSPAWKSLEELRWTDGTVMAMKNTLAKWERDGLARRIEPSGEAE